MAEPLGPRLVRAGLVTRELLEAASAQSENRGIGLAEALVACGLSEDALAGYMLADGHGPLLEARVLAAPERSCAERVGRTMADALLALPVRTSSEGVIVAMADPSDEAAIRELHARLSAPIVAKVARVGELRAAITEALRPQPVPEPVREPAPLSDPNENAADRPKIPVSRARPQPRRAPLTGTRPVPFALPDDGVEDQSWGDLAPTATVRRSSAPPVKPEPPGPAARARFGPKAPSPGAIGAPGDVGVFLASLRAAASRDEALRIGCEAGLTVGATAVFLGLRKGVLVGWEGLGPGISRDALRNLWIPATSASVFKRVIESGKPHHGPHGATPADQLFRAATGCRGAKLAAHPVHVGGKPMGLLCIDAPRYGESGLERLAVVSHALGEALKRLILARKG